jgi:hypothetical protein
MSNTNTEAYPKTTNEPKVHSFIKDSFVFVRSAGMRLAPEVLVLELMREIFFKDHHGDSSETQYLDPDAEDPNGPLYTENERAVIYALKGRRKKSNASRTQSFFAPAYPHLAEHAWPGKNRERVINNFLLAGPVAQHFWGAGNTSGGLKQQELLVDLLHRALIGTHAESSKDTTLANEILAQTLAVPVFAGSQDLPKRNIKNKTEHTSFVFSIENDEIAARITHDLSAVCRVEQRLPRMQWLQLLMTYLRFALPMWLLAQMQISKLLHGWLIDAVDNGIVRDGATILKDMETRNRSLLHPTVTPTRELFEHIDRYIKARIEINIFLYALEKTDAGKVIAERILYLQPAKSSDIDVLKFLSISRDSVQQVRELEWFKKRAEGASIQTFLTREAEQFSAWRNPRTHGQGKNIDEFFRLLYRATLGDESGGYLFLPQGRGAMRGFKVFPGQQLLETITYLAQQEKLSAGKPGGAGKLVLQDVEGHFAEYGIDFSAAADARPLLMNELQALGLLTGSPDAGSSVAVASPY